MIYLAMSIQVVNLMKVEDYLSALSQLESRRRRLDLHQLAPEQHDFGADGDERREAEEG